ncbi:hypothetical protein QOT17_011822 [Balamuthia mandrillaris]
MEGDGGRGSSYGGGGGRSTSHTPPPPRYTSSSSSHPHAHYPTTTSSDHDYFGGGGGGRGGLQPQPVAGVPSPSALPLLMLDQASLLSLSAQQLQQALYQQLLLPPLALPLAQPPAAAANPFHPNALQRSYAEEDVGYGRAALPHPQRHGKDGQSHAAAATATLCRDFQSGRCQRGSVCKYAHVREVCADFRQGKCQRGATCKYLHPSPYSSSVSAYSSSPYLTTPTTGSAVGVGGARPGGEYCRDFRRGGCARGDLCRYVHAGSSSVEMCRDYQRGECSRGSSCKFLHELPGLRVTSFFSSVLFLTAPSIYLFSSLSLSLSFSLIYSLSHPFCWPPIQREEEPKTHSNANTEITLKSDTTKDMMTRMRAMKIIAMTLILPHVAEHEKNRSTRRHLLPKARKKDQNSMKNETKRRKKMRHKPKTHENVFICTYVLCFSFLKTKSQQKK